MANIYVSQTATNGYAIGNDSNSRAQAASKSTPKLTVVGAVAAAQAGDTIVINDGTYTETSFIKCWVANLTINAENALQAIIRTSSGTARVVHQGAESTGLTLGSVVIDANGTQESCITQDSNNAVNDLTISGTKLIGFTVSAITTYTAVNVTFDKGWSINCTANGAAKVSGIDISPVGTGSIVIKDGTLTLNGGAGVTHGVRGILVRNANNDSSLIISGNTITLDAAAAGTAMNGISGTNTGTGCTALIHDNDITISDDNANAGLFFIHASGYDSVEIYDNEITEGSLQTVSCYGVYIPNSAVACHKSWVYNNTINGYTGVSNGIGIIIGDDSGVEPTYSHTINGAWVHGNNITNKNHMILLGWITKGIVQGNTLITGVIGAIGKYSINCLFTGNILKGISTGGGLRSKAGNGDVFANNTVIMTTESNAMGLGILATDASINIVYNNNIVYMVDITALCVNIVDTSTAVFNNNNYYSATGFANNPFVYQGTAYTDIAAWIAAQEASALNIDPDFVDYANGDYRVPASNSDLYHAGVYAGADARDYKGRPFYVKPTVGAYEVANGDACLARTARAS